MMITHMCNVNDINIKDIENTRKVGISSLCSDTSMETGKKDEST